MPKHQTQSQDLTDDIEYNLKEILQMINIKSDQRQSKSNMQLSIEFFKILFQNLQILKQPQHKRVYYSPELIIFQKLLVQLNTSDNFIDQALKTLIGNLLHSQQYLIYPIDFQLFVITLSTHKMKSFNIQKIFINNQNDNYCQQQNQTIEKHYRYSQFEPITFDQTFKFFRLQRSTQSVIPRIVDNQFLVDSQILLNNLQTYNENFSFIRFTFRNKSYIIQKFLPAVQGNEQLQKNSPTIFVDCINQFKYITDTIQLRRSLLYCYITLSKCNSCNTQLDEYFVNNFCKYFNFQQRSKGQTDLKPSQLLGENKDYLCCPEQAVIFHSHITGLNVIHKVGYFSEVDISDMENNILQSNITNSFKNISKHVNCCDFCNQNMQQICICGKLLFPFMDMCLICEICGSFQCKQCGQTCQICN